MHLDRGFLKAVCIIHSKLYDIILQLKQKDRCGYQHRCTKQKSQT